MDVLQRLIDEGVGTARTSGQVRLIEVVSRSARYSSRDRVLPPNECPLPAVTDALGGEASSATEGAVRAIVDALDDLVWAAAPDSAPDEVKHRSAAAELIGPDGAGWVSYGPGEVIEGPSGIWHSIRTGERPMVCLYTWTGDMSFDDYQFGRARSRAMSSPLGTVSDPSVRGRRPGRRTGCRRVVSGRRRSVGCRRV